ncbi:hypothetical protein ACOI1H_22020 [Loktanella sp. DJP18]|uniref:hypothetical protein n=1 Tax=Loktanella sp. DJP18 TaxID=3409788 RepID=UPI003BB7AB04
MANAEERKDSQKTTPKRMLVTLLLDRSGSMQGLKDDTIGGINAYRAKLRNSGEDIRYSQVHFDTDYAGKMDLEKVHIAVPVGELGDMTDADYQPRGGTPLIDAACATIRAVASSLVDAGKVEGTKVVIAIQTDGRENGSRENTWDGLRSLIAEKEALGWEFVFMGAGINAYEQGSRMGIMTANTLSYGKNKAETEAAFAETGSNSALFAGGGAATMAYSVDQKLLSGDLHI